MWQHVFYVNFVVMLLLYRWFNKGIPQVQAEELASQSESD